MRKQQEIDKEFEQIKRNLIEFFKLNSKTVFLYLKNGTSIKNHYSIPENEFCLFIS